MFRIFLLVLIFNILIACGGGGNSSTSSSLNPLPISPPASNTNDEWTKKVPNYNGLTSDFEIKPTEASRVVLDTLDTLDFVQMILFGDTYAPAYIFSENAKSPVSDEVECETGSFVMEEIEANSKSKGTYSNCLVDGLIVDGEIRVLTNRNAVDLILDIQLQDSETDEYISIGGYFTLTSQYRAVVNLLFTQGDNEIWINELSVKLNAYLNVKGLETSGSIYISDQGKLTVNSNIYKNSDEFDLEVSIKGNIEIVAYVALQDNLKFQYSDEFLPVRLTLQTTNEEVFNDVNLAPTAKLDSEYFSVDRNQVLTIEATNSTDPDGDLLSVSWEVVSNNVEAMLVTNNGLSVDLLANKPDKYTIRLTVSDTSGATSHTEAIIDVLKLAPQIVNSRANQQIVIGESYSNNFSVNNDDSDGPFTYRIQYGPANIHIDQYGKLSWDGVVPSFGKPLTINYAVMVENSDKHSVLVDQIVVTPEPVTPQQMLADEQAYISAKGRYQKLIIPKFSKRTNILSQGGKHYKELNLNTVDVSTEILISEHTEATYQDVYDYNKDGVDDYWFSGSKETDSFGKLVYSIFYRDGKTGEENFFIQLDHYSKLPTLRLVDVDNDSEPELVTSESHWRSDIYDLESKAHITEASGYVIDLANERLGCDFTGDGYIDFPTKDAITGKKFYEVSFNSSNLITVDFNGDGNCELVEYGDSINWVDVLNDDKIEDFLPDLADVNSMASGDFDGDGKDELIIDYRPYPYNLPDKLVFIKMDDNQQFTTTELSYGESGDSFSRNNYVYDFNQDGKDELLSYDNGSILVHSLTDGALNNTVRLNKLEAYDYKFVDFANEQLIVERLGSTDKVSTIDSSLNEYVLFERGGFSGVTVINDEVVVFFKSYPGLLAKSTGEIDWSIDVSVKYHYLSNLDIFKNVLISRESGRDYDLLINPTNGEIIYEIARNQYNGATSYFTEPKSGFPFTLVSPPSSELIKIDSTYTVSILDTNVPTDFWAEYNRYSYIQLDNDDAMEVMAYWGWPTQSYIIMDTDTLDLETKDNLNTGSTDTNLLQQNVHLQCFKWDSNCRNAIILDKKYQDISGLANGERVKVVDKLSGNLIWESPELNADDILFNRISNKISTFVVSDGVLYRLN